MPNTPAAFVASGDIRNFRFVTPDGNHKVAEADANEQIAGITRGGSRYAPLSDLSITELAAIAGEEVPMLGDGEEGLILSGAAFSAGARLKSDNDGRAVTVATTGDVLQQYGAEAMEEATAANQLVRVMCRIGAQWAPT